MTNQTNDPIAQIKAAEEKARKTLQTEREYLEKDLVKSAAAQGEKIAAHETDLRDKGNGKLQTVKKEATEVLKSKMATAQSKNNTLISDAKSKQQDGIKDVVNVFMDHVKA